MLLAVSGEQPETRTRVCPTGRGEEGGGGWHCLVFVCLFSVCVCFFVVRDYFQCRRQCTIMMLAALLAPQCLYWVSKKCVCSERVSRSCIAAMPHLSWNGPSISLNQNATLFALRRKSSSWIRNQGLLLFLREFYYACILSVSRRLSSIFTCLIRNAVFVQTNWFRAVAVSCYCVSGELFTDNLSL